MGIRHIIFDNDGVNIDSEDVAMQVMDDFGYALVKRYSPDADLVPGHIYRTYPGTSTDRIVQALIDAHGLGAELLRQDYEIAEGRDVAEAIADLITLETNARFRQELRAIPGIAGALEEIRCMFGPDNMALATTSRTDRMDISLECAVDPDTGVCADLALFYPAGERRRSGYGHANKYEEAFTALGWNPAETVVVEDSLSGVTKAKAYSPDVRVVGTVAAKFYEDKIAQARALMDAGASLVVFDIADLPAAVAWLDADMDPAQEPDFTGRVYMPGPAIPPSSGPFMTI